MCFISYFLYCPNRYVCFTYGFDHFRVNGKFLSFVKFCGFFSNKISRIQKIGGYTALFQKELFRDYFNRRFEAGTRLSEIYASAYKNGARSQRVHLYGILYEVENSRKTKKKRKKQTTTTTRDGHVTFKYDLPRIRPTIHHKSHTRTHTYFRSAYVRPFRRGRSLC